MRVLVTGGAGYIGSHACKALAMAGHEPVVYDNLVYGNREAVRWGELEQGDILDSDRLDEVLSHYKPDAVMHFAAFAYVGESVENPAKYYRNNMSGSINLLDAMRRHDVNRIIFSSTCATYGIPAQLPITEDLPQNPINPYGFTKLAVEQALRDYGEAYGLAWTALRYFNAAGCDADGELGEDHDPETHAIPLAILAALGSGKTFTVFGTDYETPDGTALRDYIHVSDLADAHVKALRYLEGGGTSDVFNLATGNAVSVKQIVDAVGSVVGQPVPVESAPRRAGDPPALYASSAKAQHILGWQPQYLEIERTVETASNWFKRKHNENR